MMEERPMSEQQNEPTNAVSNDYGPDDREPTAERQAELRKLYESNVAVGKPPYAGVEISSRGELTWIIHERGWKPGTAIGRNEIPDLRDTSLVGDMRNVNLESANLSGAFITLADFRGGKMTKANLSNTSIEIAEFSDADLRNANLTGASVSTAIFRGAHMLLANLSRAYVTGIFDRAELSYSCGYVNVGRLLVFSGA
jgi:Pentapeptide repeats (8 copies)